MNHEPTPQCVCTSERPINLEMEKAIALEREQRIDAKIRA